ncbi:cationic amino acid transporter 2-like [Oppia nitens]|uniref:cationic amino acid transporter 2-like n=1 Tax=Oppia nitens TaxID=1686743 RepID=UPI0023DCC114|nr:cationic amino acid transporter 2-like [Oppia nitens]
MVNCLLFQWLVRRKHIDLTRVESSQLARVLTLFDLICLGIGSTLGTGLYVLAGDVASEKTGPAVVIAFLIAAITSLFAGLCYAELAARVPRAGSAYIYTYVSVGEFMAFIIGWNLILEYVIGTASVARAYSVYLDALCSGTISRHLRQWVPMNLSGLGPYPDPLACGLTLILTVLLAIGVKESIRLHTYMTCANLLVVAFIIVTGSIKADRHNWAISKSEIPDKYAKYGGDGGFLPHGFTGLMAGAATCFYAFVGFDAIATTGEEALNPKRSIPLSIIISLFFAFAAYFGVSTVQTLMLPYYMQNKQYTNGAPLPYIYDLLGWHWAKWIVSVGALCGLSTSLLGCMYPLPRILYSMANDGLVFRFLTSVNHRTRTPLMATLLGGLLCALMATLFDITELVDMMSIGTLLAYTLVAESIVIIRYANDLDFINETVNNNDCIDYCSTNTNNNTSANCDQSTTTTTTVPAVCRQLLNCNRLIRPTRVSSIVANTLTAIITLLIIVLDIELVKLYDQLLVGHTGAIIGVVLTLVLVILVMICLTRQPTIAKSKHFEVPWIPLIPFLSVFVNFYLMLNLSTATWIRFAVWMAIGFLIYFGYGIRNSNLNIIKVF